jgi:hypothetical protein
MSGSTLGDKPRSDNSGLGAACIYSGAIPYRWIYSGSIKPRTKQMWARSMLPTYTARKRFREHRYGCRNGYRIATAFGAHPSMPARAQQARFATRYERRQGDPNRRRFQRLFNLANGIAGALRAGHYLGCRSYQILSTRKRFWKRFRKAKRFTIRDQKVYV